MLIIHISLNSCRAEENSYKCRKFLTFFLHFLLKKIILTWKCDCTLPSKTVSPFSHVLIQETYTCFPSSVVGSTDRHFSSLLAFLASLSTWNLLKQNIVLIGTGVQYNHLWVVSLWSESKQLKSKGKNPWLFCNVGNLVHINKCWIK
jgi:hypothetical protein